MINLYEYDNPVSDYGIKVPAWIDQGITAYDVASILEGGCASGAYMPAVTYYQAKATMNEHGDDVLEFIEDTLGEIPQSETPLSWSGMACFYLSLAVELWAASIEDELKDAIEAEDNGDE